jgi:hypothetical protein
MNRRKGRVSHVKTEVNGGELRQGWLPVMKRREGMGFSSRNGGNEGARVACVEMEMWEWEVSCVETEANEGGEGVPCRIGGERRRGEVTHLKRRQTVEREGLEGLPHLPVSKRR